MLLFLKVSEKGPHFMEQSQEQKQIIEEAPSSRSLDKEKLRLGPSSSINTILSLNIYSPEGLYHTVCHLIIHLFGLVML